jgi:serine/threonine protein kinase
MTVRSSIEDFDLLEKLGSGSFGTVFKVRRRIDDIVYVIKTVRIAELSMHEQEEAINEVKLLSSLDSPFVVRYYDSFIDSDSLHIVMEYCNRGDLQSLVKKAKSRHVKCLKEDVTWDLGLQILLGLHYLHKRKILHRDLKSANVFLMKESSQQYFAVKIGDLGVAKLLDTSTAFAKTIVGTPYYLSPELCADKPYRDKSDCWALGVLLYECCTLKHPFEARNQCALIMKIIQAQVEPPSSSLVSSGLTTLILWLLQKDPTHRPTIEELLNESVIREKLREHHLALPEEVEHMTPGHRLQAAIDKAKSTRKRRGGGQTHSGGTRTLKGLEKAATAATAAPSSSQSLARSASEPVQIPLALAPAAAAPPPVREVRGDRVRGGAGKPRIASRKALLRHQVRNTTGASEQNVAEAKEQDNMLRALDAALGGVDLSDADDRGEEENTADSKESQALTDIQQPVVEPKSNRYEGDTKVVGAEHEEDRGYEEDFEDYESDSESNSRAPSSGQHDVTEEEGSAAVGDSRVPDPDWKNVWPGASSPEDKEEMGGISADMDCRNDHDGGSDDFEHTLRTQLSILSKLVRDSRQKSIALLGDMLFRKVYKLCSDHMNEEGDEDDEGGGNKTNEAFVRELEEALCDQLKGGVEIACDAVFGVKVLLALESRLELLVKDIESMP